MKKLRTLLAGMAVASASLAMAGDPTASPSSPRPVPLTRPEMKQLLEDMKDRKPRFPLPELTEEEKEKLGERGGGYEGRLRYHYLADGQSGPVGFGGGGGGTRTGTGQRPAGDFTRNADENMTLDYQFKTKLFWIVSRTNNCQYCLGHQEQKLSATGMREEEIAALDFDWTQFDPAQRAAFAYARKMTYEPNRLGDADIEALRKHYTDLQILEMTMSIAGNNSINRWKEGSGTPQSRSGSNFFRRDNVKLPKDQPVPDETFLTPTAEAYKALVTKVAPLQVDPAGQPTRLAVSNRPKLESREEVEKALAACAERKARLPMLSDDDARKALGEVAPEGSLPNWMRLMAVFPREGGGRVRSLRASEEKGNLTPLLKAQVSWIIARNDRAWYATGLAKQRLRELGQTDDQIFALDGDWSAFTPGERAMFTVAKKLASTPIVMTDDDANEAMKHTGPREVVQLVSYVTGRAYFDRVTEAAGLPLEAR